MSRLDIEDPRERGIASDEESPEVISIDECEICGEFDCDCDAPEPVPLRKRARPMAEVVPDYDLTTESAEEEEDSPPKAKAPEESTKKVSILWC